MNNVPLVTVVVCTYNSSLYIEQTLKSIISQIVTFKVEVFISDDFSSDNTSEIINDFELSLKSSSNFNIRKRYRNCNVGASINGQTAINDSNSRYIALCDGDDYWTDPYKLQKQVDFMEANPEYGLCFTKTNYLKNDVLELQELPITRIEGDYELKDLYFNYNFICTASVLFPRFDFPDWLSKLSYGDLAIYTILCKNKKIKCLDFEGAVYRIHENGVWQGKTRRKQILMGLKFNKEIYSHVDVEIKEIIKLKSIVLMEELINIEYNNRFSRGIYYRFLKFKFFPKN